MAPLQPPTWPPAWPPAPPLLFKHSKPGGPNSNNHHAFFIFAATVLVLGIIAVIAVAGSGNPATGPPASGTAGIGQAATDSGLTFLVKSLTCGANAAAAVTETVPSGAKECIATITLTAKGASQTYFFGEQYAYDGAGNRFSADENGVDNVASETFNDWQAQVSPGFPITVLLPFQIPSPDHLVELKLHNGSSPSGGRSGGVTVKVLRGLGR